jgi:hypothetical protein
MIPADFDADMLGCAPPESVVRWLSAVRRMDRDALDSFVRRTWRTWRAESLRPLAVAVDARRSELDGE